MADSVEQKKILIGNGFPTSLIRRQVVITPFCVFVLRNAMINAKIYSFWGHDNTLEMINAILGTDLTPASERPVISLNDQNYPEFEGIEFRECWIGSPNYVNHFRPKIGEEIPSDKITSWQILKIKWC